MIKHSHQLLIIRLTGRPISRNLTSSTSTSSSTSPLSTDHTHRTTKLPATRPRDCSRSLWKFLQGLQIDVHRAERSTVQPTTGLQMPKAGPSQAGTTKAAGPYSKRGAVYAVAVGRKTGVFPTWGECEAQVKGFPGSKYKKFNSDAEARSFVSSGGTSSNTAHSSASATPKGIDGTSTVNSASVPLRTPASTSTGRATSPITHAQPSELPPALAALARDGWHFTTGGNIPGRVGKKTALVVYTDGSGIANGQQRARAGLGVWWGDRGEACSRNIAERVPGELQTNNRGELLSVIRALETDPFPSMPLEIRTDSQYVISCMTTYIPIWISNGFKTSAKAKSGSGGKGRGKGQGKGEVKNVDMIKHLLVLLRRRPPGAGVRFKHVYGHVGTEGNEGADRLAKMGAYMPALPDRTSWLDPDDPDVEAETTDEPSSAIDVEIDEDWLMSPEELDQFEADLEHDDDD